MMALAGAGRARGISTPSAQNAPLTIQRALAAITEPGKLGPRCACSISTFASGKRFQGCACATSGIGENISAALANGNSGLG
jgi:hypothetical protein